MEVLLVLSTIPIIFLSACSQVPRYAPTLHPHIASPPLSWQSHSMLIARRHVCLFKHEPWCCSPLYSLPAP
jgi:hypothetical protein